MNANLRYIIFILGSVLFFFHRTTLRSTTIVCFLFFVNATTRAQEGKTYSSVINSVYSSGHISEHSPNISHASRGFTHGFDITARNLLGTRTKMNDRPNLVYLDLGFHYINYPKDYLGESYALSFGRSGTVFQKNRFEVYGQFLHGLGYCTNPYSPTNNKNNALSTSVGFHIHANLSATYQVYKNWYALASVAFTHLSNGAIKKPNLGYNVMSTNIGVAYRVKDKTINETYEYYKQSKKYYFHVSGSYFQTASDSFSGEKFPSYSGHVQVERNLSLHHSLLLSIDYNNYQRIGYPEMEKPEDAGSNDHNFFGLSFGGTWKYSIIDFSATAGYYIITPWHVDRKLYNLVHFKIYALKNAYLLTGLKAHGFKAVTFEAGLGFRI